VKRDSARRAVLAISALCVFSTATVAMAGATDKSTTVIDDPAYTHAQRLVEIEPGRRLNLYCTGKGSPTVVFDSGGGGETVDWAPVQPVIAGLTVLPHVTFLPFASWRFLPSQRSAV
jgi:hypothetical protein